MDKLSHTPERIDPRTKTRRVVFVALSLALSAPVAMTVTAQLAQAEGWVVRTGTSGQIICDPGHTPDCPDDGG